MSRIVNDGPRYLVPRRDGRVLVGSTEEEAGFDNRTTGGAIQELLRFAFELAPALAAARALLDTDLDAEAIARKAMAIAADICVYTNTNIVVETLESAR